MKNPRFPKSKASITLKDFILLPLAAVNHGHLLYELMYEEEGRMCFALKV